MKTVHKTGVYKDFSGKIKWRSVDCIVRNADFEIFKEEEKEKDKNKEDIVFDDVVFVSGYVYWCVIKNALNLGCCFNTCEIEYMINKDGDIYRCNWYDGIFEGGDFRISTWHDGIWIKGNWGNGKNKQGDYVNIPPNEWKEIK